jgi:methanethiol S-methyltransferase
VTTGAAFETFSDRSFFDAFSGGPDVKRWLFFVYGVACHLMFFAIFAYMAGFVGDLLVPTTIDSPAEGSVAAAVVIDLALLALFAAQHSIMARPAFN